MEILLDNIIVHKEIHDKVVDYLNQPRKVLDSFPSDTYPKMEYGLGALFTCDTFAIRCENTWEAMKQVGFVKEPSIIKMDNIVTYIDSDENPITLHVIISEDNDITIISLEEDSDDDEYWMGIAYAGRDLAFATMLDAMGIDLTLAIRGRLTAPAPAPEGYDNTLPLPLNVEKVCVSGGVLPDVLGVLETLMITAKGDFNYKLSTAEHHALTYEDMCYHIARTELNFITYRDNLTENATYVMIYNRTTGEVIKQMVLPHNGEHNYTLIPNPDYKRLVLESVVNELW